MNDVRAWHLEQQHCDQSRPLVYPVEGANPDCPSSRVVGSSLVTFRTNYLLQTMGVVC